MERLIPFKKGTCELRVKYVVYYVYVLGSFYVLYFKVELKLRAVAVGKVIRVRLRLGRGISMYTYLKMYLKLDSLIPPKRYPGYW